MLSVRKMKCIIPVTSACVPTPAARDVTAASALRGKSVQTSHCEWSLMIL